jgi:cathepsin B
MTQTTHTGGLQIGKGFNTILRSSPIFQKQYAKLIKDKESAFLSSKNIQLPREFDGREVWKNYLPPIRAQGSCGSCYSFASAFVVGARHNISTNNNPKVILSPASLIICNYGEDEYGITESSREEGTLFSGGLETKGQEAVKKTGCTGNTLINTYNYIFSSGIVEERCIPYDATYQDWNVETVLPTCEKLMGNEYSNCSDGSPARYFHTGGLYFVTGTEEFGGSERNIRMDIYKFGPVSSGIILHDDFLDWNGIGIYSYDGTSVEKGGHAIVIVGWGEENDTKYWIVANSWGTTWGDGGYFKIRRGTNECDIEANVIVGFLDAPGIRPYIDFPNLWDSHSLFLRGIWGSNELGGYTTKTIFEYQEGLYPDLDIYPLYNEVNVPHWREFIAGDLSTRHYPSKYRYTDSWWSRNWRTILVIMVVGMIIYGIYRIRGKFIHK